MNHASRTIANYFSLIVVILGCLTCPLISRASVNTADLTLILDGPFVVCDNGGNTLTVLVPNLIENPSPNTSGVDISHYPPGLRGMLSEIGLDKANDPPNPNIPPSPKTF